jgi:uncharacterized protein YbjT (DUF2867 family)
MNIAVTTPTGHVGSAVVDFLLDSGEAEVTLLGRRPEKLQEFARRGAKLAIGAQDDTEFLIRATKDADAFFWVTPPGYGSDDLRAYQNRMGRAAATAIRTHGIPRVVNLSSVGAHLTSGAGPIFGLHDVEGLLEPMATYITHLRPGFFFENLFWQLDSIRESGRISLPLSGSCRYPMIACRDIGGVAAALLADEHWSGHTTRELHGPADLCFDEVADVISQAVGHEVSYIPCDSDTSRQMMRLGGMSDNAIDLVLEMYDAVETGRLRPVEPRSDETTTPTTIEEFVRETLMPMIVEPARH